MRLARAACRMSDAAAAPLMPLSCAACCKSAYDAGGSAMLILVDFAIRSPYLLPRYQSATLCLP